MFKIDADQFYWICGPEDDPEDLCLHGHVMVQIGKTVMEYDGTVSATALYLLKTLTEDMLIDTVGMSTLFLPDLQYHFHDMDPNWVVNHAYNAASYILEHDTPIKDGETVDGVADGQMSREIQWKCRYEDALIQPPREVLDIHMGEFAAGQR